MKGFFSLLIPAVFAVPGLRAAPRAAGPYASRSAVYSAPLALPASAIGTGPGGVAITAPSLAEGSRIRLPKLLPASDLSGVVAPEQAVWVRAPRPNAPDAWERGVVLSKHSDGKRAYASVRSWAPDRRGYRDRSVPLDSGWARELKARHEEDDYMPLDSFVPPPVSRSRLPRGARVWVRVGRAWYRSSVLGEASLDGRPAVRVRAWGFRTRDGQFEAIDHLAPLDDYWGDRVSLRPERDERVPDAGDAAIPRSRPLLKPGDPVWLHAKGNSGFVEAHRAVVSALDEAKGAMEVDFWDAGSNYPVWGRRRVQTVPVWAERVTPRFEEPK